MASQRTSSSKTQGVSYQYVGAVFNQRERERESAWAFKIKVLSWLSALPAIWVSSRCAKVCPSEVDSVNLHMTQL